MQLSGAQAAGRIHRFVGRLSAGAMLPVPSSTVPVWLCFQLFSHVFTTSRHCNLVWTSLRLAVLLGKSVPFVLFSFSVAGARRLMGVGAIRCVTRTWGGFFFQDSDSCLRMSQVQSAWSTWTHTETNNQTTFSKLGCLQILRSLFASLCSLSEQKEWRCFAGYLPGALSRELRPRFFDIIRKARAFEQSEIWLYASGTRASWIFWESITILQPTKQFSEHQTPAPNRLKQTAANSPRLHTLQ